MDPNSSSTVATRSAREEGERVWEGRYGERAALAKDRGRWRIASVN